MAKTKQKATKRTKMDPERFGLAYSMIKIKEPQAGVRRVGELLHLSPTTVQKYLTDPEIAGYIDTALIQEITDRDKEQGVEYASEIMDTAFKLNAKRIKDLTETKVIKHPDGTEETKEPTGEMWEEARRISLQMLSIARTEADIRRALTTIQFNIDNRRQTVNVTQCNRCMEDLVEELIPLLCKKDKDKVVDYVMASKSAEVSA